MIGYFIKDTIIAGGKGFKNMNEVVETIKYKNCLIEIYQDDNTQSPDEWEDDNVFLVGYHREFTIEKNRIITKIEAQAIGSGDYGGYDDGSGYFRHRCKEIERKYHIFGLEAYIHGGVVLALSYEGNFVDRKWDVSQLGLVFVAKTQTKDRKKAKKLAEGLIESWNEYLSGNVYGFITKDLEEGFDNHSIDSCWGFYGNFEKSGIIDKAKGAIDYYLENEKPKMRKELNKAKKDYSKISLGELLSSENEGIRRNAIGILKQLQKVSS